MYLVPSPMRPDTFSQYGYADASNLRALRRGYGHDIYPQYPTTYNMPRVINGLSGLGAFKHKGYTVDYYAEAGTLSFADKGLKKLYEGMRNADIEFQKNANAVLKGISPVFDVIEVSTAGKIRADDLEKSLRLKLPTWGVALVLEVAAGKRPLDKGFQAAMKECAKDMGQAKAAFAVITGLNTLALGLSVAPTPAAPFFLGIVPITGPLAGIAGTSTAVAAILEPIFKSLGDGKPPTKKQMKDMMEGAARVSGQKLPSNAEVEKAYEEFDKAAKAAKAAKTEQPKDKSKGGSKDKSKDDGKEHFSLSRSLAKGAQSLTPPTQPLEPAPAKPFPIVPVVAGLGVLTAVVLFARSR